MYRVSGQCSLARYALSNSKKPGGLQIIKSAESVPVAFTASPQ
jgi:hypothetical protein